MEEITYRAVENGEHTFDLVAVNNVGYLLARVEDATGRREYAENIAWLFTKNRMLPLHLEEAVSMLVGVLL